MDFVDFVDFMVFVSFYDLRAESARQGFIHRATLGRLLILSSR